MADAHTDNDVQKPTLKQHGDITKTQKKDNPKYSSALSQRQQQ